AASLIPSITTAATAPAAVVAVFLQVTIVGRLYIGDVQKAVATDPEIHERCLDARFDVDDASLIDIADITFLTGAFDIQLFENAVFDDGNAAFLGLQDVDKHLFLHAIKLFRKKLLPGSLSSPRGLANFSKSFMPPRGARRPPVRQGRPRPPVPHGSVPGSSLLPAGRLDPIDSGFHPAEQSRWASRQARAPRCPQPDASPRDTASNRGAAVEVGGARSNNVNSPAETP